MAVSWRQNNYNLTNWIISIRNLWPRKVVKPFAVVSAFSWYTHDMQNNDKKNTRIDKKNAQDTLSRKKAIDVKLRDDSILSYDTLDTLWYIC